MNEVSIFPPDDPDVFKIYRIFTIVDEHRCSNLSKFVVSLTRRNNILFIHVNKDIDSESLNSIQSIICKLWNLFSEDGNRCEVVFDIE